MNTLSVSLGEMRRSGIREVFDLAHTIPDCIHLETGEPDFPTAGHICDAAARAARAGLTKYTPNAGIPELREVIASKVANRTGVDTTHEYVTVTPGGVAAAWGTIRALTDPGDAVLMADPSWPNFRMMCEIQSLTPQYFPTYAEDDFVPRAEELEPHITDATKLVILNSPCNPTGAVISKDRLEELIDVIGSHGLWLMADEVYEEMVFDDPPTSALTLSEDGRVVLINSLSKTYAMTGWRCGYAVAVPDVARAITKCQEPTTSCVNAPTQWAAVAALTGPQDAVLEMRDAYRERRDRALGMLSAAGVRTNRPGGAFYLWIDISAAGMSDTEFARRLCLEREVAVVPGTAFGPASGDYVRISLATSEELLLEGVMRLTGAVNEWRTG